MKYPTFLISLLIIIAVLIPGKNLPDVGVGGYDKVIHMGMFLLWALAVRYDFDTKPFRYIVFLVTGLLFSVLTEVLQLVVEGRGFDVYDMVADTTGLVAGLLIGGRVIRWLKQKLNPDR